MTIPKRGFDLPKIPDSTTPGIPGEPPSEEVCENTGARVPDDNQRYASIKFKLEQLLNSEKPIDE